jgi:transposase
MQKFRDVLGRWERSELSMMEAGELLGMSERQFRRYRDRYEEEGLAGLCDRRLGKASAKRVPADERQRMLELYETFYGGWSVKHFHEHLKERHGFAWGYTWTKAQLHAAGLVARAKRRGAHRRKRPRKPCEGMMLHQDGSRFAWLEGQPMLDLVVTMDDATSEIYSAFLVEEEGTASSFRGLLETFAVKGLPSSLYTDRGSHYFHTPKAGEKVDKSVLTQVGRALQRLGIEHIPAYSPEARGRSERMFGTLQDRLPKELKLAGITDIEAANAFIAAVYLPAHNGRFARPPEIPESGFVAADPAQLGEILCEEDQRVVGRDNTVGFGGLRLQLPESRLRHHYVKAIVKVRQYPNGTLAVFHGPRCIGRYDAEGREIGEPIAPMVHPCSTPSRRGLEASRPAPPAVRRPALTAPRHRVGAPWPGKPARVSFRFHPIAPSTQSAQPMCYKNRTT